MTAVPIYHVGSFLTLQIICVCFIQMISLICIAHSRVFSIGTVTSGTYHRMCCKHINFYDLNYNTYHRMCSAYASFYDRNFSSCGMYLKVTCICIILKYYAIQMWLIKWLVNHFSRNVRDRTVGHMRPATILISLRISEG